MDMLQARGLHPTDFIVAPKFRRALALLLEARSYAEQTNSSHWEFAVETRQLLRLGLSENDLRFLVRTQYLDYAQEVKIAGCFSRQFRPTCALSITRRTCFVLTGKGIEAALNSFVAPSRSASNGDSTNRSSRVALTQEVSPIPVWETDRRVLSFGGQIVKHFKRRAVNQELILTAFQEEGWPTRILDPLSPHPSHDVKRRLSDTIKFLNRCQRNELISFHGDGSGEGVIWRTC